jgi:L-aspartate oxidase
MEFFQFHPTCLFHPQAKSFLLTEALRGEGAILRRPDGTPFMTNYDRRAELAPRDIVARAIDSEMKVHGFESVYLDISHRGADFVRTRFPNVYERCLGYGFDLAREPVPVVPTAHYSCGGVVADRTAMTSLPRLYACGETACTGALQRQPSGVEFLLEALVFAHRAANTSSPRRRRDAPSRPHARDRRRHQQRRSVVVTQN